MCKRFFLVLCAAPLFAELPLRNLSLADAEEIALEYNKSFLIAQESTFQAAERESQAVSRWLPALAYRAEFRDIDKKELFFDVFSDIFTFSHQGYSSIFQLSQPIFSTDLLFGLKSSQFEAQAISYAQANTKNELLLAVRDRYYAVLFYEKKLGIERENIDYLAYALEQEQGKLNAGSSTPFEVNQSKVAVANAISLYYATLKGLKNARNALVISLGIDPLLEPEICLSETVMPIETIPELAIKLQDLEQRFHYNQETFPTTEDYLKHIDSLEYARKLTLFSKAEVQEYLDLALCLRPDLQARKLQIDVANQQVNQKLGTYLPQISGYVRYSYNDVELGTVPFFKESYDLSAGLVLTWNLFDSMLREHEVREARSVKYSSKIQYDQEWQRIEVQIRNGLYQLEEALLTYSSATQAVYVAEQARDQAKDKLKFGRIAPLEYRDSVNQLSQARNQQNQASFDLLAAYYQVRFATGIDAK
ncbi:MAG: TolC family protein [Verrucomicrobia bacterium]|nr:TolC family protein [Verrucomicrobiota bacterium]